MEYIDKISIIDLEASIDLLNLAKNFMYKNDIKQWNASYPNKKILEKDIINGNMYGYYINNKLTGFATLILEKDVYYLKRVVTHTNYTGKSISTKLILFLEKIIKNGKLISITNYKNIYMQKVLEKNNFIKMKEYNIKNRERVGLFYEYQKNINI